MKIRFCILSIFLAVLLMPMVQAAQLIEVFVPNGGTIQDVVDEELLEEVQSSEAILISWHSDNEDPLNILAAEQRAVALNASTGDIRYDGTLLAGDIQSGQDIQVHTRWTETGDISIDAQIRLNETIGDEVIIRWLILRPSISVDSHPLAPNDLNVVAYHAWTSTFNRSEGADEVWNHVVQPTTLLEWGIEPGENVRVVTSLISMNDHLVHASGISHLDARVAEKGAKSTATASLIMGIGILSLTAVFIGEKKRQQSMPKIRPIVTGNGDNIQHRIHVQAGAAGIVIDGIEGGRTWRMVARRNLPIRLEPKEETEIQIRKLRAIEHDDPCTIKMEVDGHDRWILDLRFPRKVASEEE
jgi:hypothetical protein